jgi:hypothetical protein
MSVTRPRPVGTNAQTSFRAEEKQVSQMKRRLDRGEGATGVLVFGGVAAAATAAFLSAPVVVPLVLAGSAVAALTGADLGALSPLRRRILFEEMSLAIRTNDPERFKATLENAANETEIHRNKLVEGVRAEFNGQVPEAFERLLSDFQTGNALSAAVAKLNILKALPHADSEIQADIAKTVEQALKLAEGEHGRLWKDDVRKAIAGF